MSPAQVAWLTVGAILTLVAAIACALVIRYRRKAAATRAKAARLAAEAQAARAERLRVAGEILTAARNGDEQAQQRVYDSNRSSSSEKEITRKLAQALDRESDYDAVIRIIQIRNQVTNYRQQFQSLLATLTEALDLARARTEAGQPADLRTVIEFEIQLHNLLWRLYAETRSQLTAGTSYEFASAETRVAALRQQLFDQLVAEFRNSPRPRQEIIELIAESTAKPAWGYPKLDYPPDWNHLIAQHDRSPSLSDFVGLRDLTDVEVNALVWEAFEVVDQGIPEGDSLPGVRTLVKIALAYAIARRIMFPDHVVTALNKAASGPLSVGCAPASMLAGILPTDGPLAIEA